EAPVADRVRREHHVAARMDARQIELHDARDEPAVPGTERLPIAVAAEGGEHLARPRGGGRGRGLLCARSVELLSRRDATGEWLESTDLLRRELAARLGFGERGPRVAHLRRLALRRDRPEGRDRIADRRRLRDGRLDARDLRAGTGCRLAVALGALAPDCQDDEEPPRGSHGSDPPAASIRSASAT